ncbi:hypothetical protein H8F21_13475 [Pseudomonas sp. P66]|uniref:Uncharacterized protein n=1 Tax=Pseudomonas arcuscaelestis TaxID=2710591 RepID=A0ABS2BY98_9PSED|nr:hypothetical protein [Pseudomonas arcuscaelestis]MBM5458574.1 hypothetical protein [Pseudomonas arcuscaelestis]
MSALPLQPKRDIPYSHVMIFSDVRMEEKVSEGIIGPLFFTSESEALMRITGYFLPRVEEYEELQEACLGALAAIGLDETEPNGSLSLSRLGELPVSALQELCSTYVQVRAADGYQCFYCVEQIPD